MQNDSEMAKTGENDTSDMGMEHVLYYGVNGFGITWTYLLLHIGLVFIAIIGICLNAFTIWALRGKDSDLDVSIIFISNLALSDAISDVMCVHLVMYNLVHYKNYYECAFRIGVLTGINFNSVLQLLALTLDRYCKIIHPYRYVHIFRAKPAKIFCVCSWTLSLTLCFLPLFGLRQPPIHGVNYCSFFGIMRNSYLLVMTVSFYSVFAAFMYCYYGILSTAWVQNKRFKQQQVVVKHLWWKPTKTLLILISSYFVCWLPLGTCIILHLSDGFPDYYTDDMKGTVLAYSSSLVFLDTVVNPIIYALKIKTVKAKLLNIFKFVRRRTLTSASSELTVI